MNVAQQRTEVALLVEHRGNLRMLREWAESAIERGVVVELGDGAQEPDLVIADAAGFVAARPELERRRREAQPAFLPVLLACSPRDAARMTGDTWAVADDVVTTPIRRGELEIRVDRLLTQRRMSLAVEAERDDLQRSNEDLERFAFVAAHELVSPLAVVSGSVQTLSALYLDGDERSGVVLNAALEGCERMHGLIQDILDLSRAGRSERVEDVSTQALVEDVCEELRDRVESTSGSVEYAGLPVVSADPSQLRLVLRNLIANALKFRDPGRAPRVVVEASKTAGAWQFCVRDNGVGISPAERERVFDLFARSKETSAPGSGIGLAICRRVIERVGGRIWIEPHDGPGCTFCFTVPD